MSKPIIDVTRFQVPMTDTPEIAWHYTTKTGFLEILRSRTLWASDLRFVNDSRELAYGRDLMIDCIEQHVAYHTVPRDGSLPQMPQLLFDLLEAVGSYSDTPVFAACFCEYGDQLSQWRAYGSGGGLAIGFPRGSDAEKATFADFISKNDYSFARINYSARAQRESVERFIAIFEDSVGDFYRDGTIPEGVAVTILAPVLTAFAATLKDPSFEEEHEWRAYTGGYGAQPVQYRANRSLIIPYHSLKISEPMLDALHVRVGPCADPDAVRRAVLMVLGRRGDDPRVTVSSIPYRDW